MGYTKKQRRDQKKQPFRPGGKVQKRRPQHRETDDRETAVDRARIDDQREPQALLIRSSWTEPDGTSQQDFQLVRLPAARSQEQIRQEMLSRLQARGIANGTIEMFDPDNVPPGTIPSGATIALGEPLLDS